MPTHTPGPWLLLPDPNGWTLHGAQDVTAEAFDCTEADARLIAAAPDLLAFVAALLDTSVDDAGLPVNEREYTALILKARALLASLDGKD